MQISGKTFPVRVIEPPITKGVCTLYGDGFCLVLNVTEDDLEDLRSMVPVEVFIEIRKAGG